MDLKPNSGSVKEVAAHFPLPMLEKTTVSTEEQEESRILSIYSRHLQLS
jgi:hypothetical protein